MGYAVTGAEVQPGWRRPDCFPAFGDRTGATGCPLGSWNPGEVTAGQAPGRNAERPKRPRGQIYAAIGVCARARHIWRASVASVAFPSGVRLRPADSRILRGA